MKLVVVESPTKTKSLTKYLGGDYVVMASMGHVIDLPKSQLGIKIKKKGKAYEFEPEYQVVEGKGAQLAKLQQAAKKASKVILATDPDREGEAIAYHVKEALGKVAKDFKRIVFHSITKEAVLSALEKPRGIERDLFDAQQARRVLDRLVGYKLSPVLWRKVRRGLSAGRVQSVALRLVVEREREIEKFKSEEYWPVKVEVKGKSEPFWVELNKINGKPAKVGNGKRAGQVKADLEGAGYSVVEVEQKERKAQPKPPFKTSTLQQAAANVLGWSAKKTMTVAQRLYEQGEITYHRTDSLSLAPAAVSQIRELVAKKWGKNYLPEKERFYKATGKVVAQEAHEAIRPTNLKQERLEGEGGRLYQLIWRRAMASQMAAAVYDSTKVTVEAKGEDWYQLSAVGETEKFPGWRVLYKKSEDWIKLPEVAKGEKLEPKKVEAEQKFTQPPARYNDASLVRELEKRGIGRPSTYASIISTLLNRNYVTREERNFLPTSVGVAVTDFLVKQFPQELDYDFTAKMESELDDIARGELEWQKMMGDFYGPFETRVEKVADNAKRVEVPTEKTGKKCPECKKGEVVIREGRFGKFLSCSRFPECKYTANYKEYVEGAKCPKDGGRVVVKKTRKGREFYGCENYPKCDWASWQKPRPGSF